MWASEDDHTEGLGFLVQAGGRVHAPGNGINDAADPGALAVPSLLHPLRTVRDVSGFDVTTTAYGRPAVELLAGQLTALKLSLIHI